MNDRTDHGSFLTGFTIGLFAGAASLFLFGTKKGNKVRTRLAEEWNDAKQYLESEGVIEQGKSSIRDVFKTIVDNLQDQPATTKKTIVRAKSTSSSKKPPQPATNSSIKPASKKFKGT